MTTLDALKHERDTAFAAYLAVRAAGGISCQKKQAVESAVLDWYRLAKQERQRRMGVERVMEYSNRYRLVVWLVFDGFYRWHVSRRDSSIPGYVMVSGSMCALPFEDALQIGRTELRVWSDTDER